MATTEPKDSGHFKLPGSSLDEVFKVVQGYASVGKMASLSDISKNTGMHVTVISKMLGFYCPWVFWKVEKTKQRLKPGRSLASH